jgi:hypothetical protein
MYRLCAGLNGLRSGQQQGGFWILETAPPAAKDMEMAAAERLSGNSVMANASKEPKAKSHVGHLNK